MEHSYSETSRQQKMQFLSGGGEMGALTREKDWSNTAVGPAEGWPQSLRTTLSIILNSKFPMFLWWGPELICFYNDAYRPSLGKNGKHPNILGMPAKEAWTEIWDIIKPLIDRVLEGGEATWSEDQLIPIYRNGNIEDVYWTFSYSPVKDETGKVAGVLVTCNETTEKVKTHNQLQKSEERLKLMIMQAPVSMAIFRGADYTVEIANEHALELWGRKLEDVINKPILEAMPELKKQGIQELLDTVYTTGRPFAATELKVNIERNDRLDTVFINFRYEPLYTYDGVINGIIAVGFDVTEQVLARRTVEESEQKLRTFVENAPFPIGVYTGEEMRIELANQAILDVWGKGDDVIGKLYTEILPELRNQEVFQQLNEVYTTGKPFHAQNQPLELVVNGIKQSFYFNYSFTPLYDIRGKIYGVMNTAANVTDLNVAKQKIEESEKRFRDTVRQAPLGITIFRGADFTVELANDAYLQIIDKKESDVVGRPFFEILPEVKEVVEPLLTTVLKTGIPYYGNEFPVTLTRYGKQELTYFNFVYHPLREENGIISGIMVVATDVTNSVNAKNSLVESEKQFRNLVMQSPIPMTIFRGRDFIIELANNEMIEKIWRKKESEVIGKKVLDVFPELKNQKYPELLNEVFTTGKFHREIESPAFVEGNDGMQKFYLDFEYAPLFEIDGKVSGIMITVNDVSEKVEARQKVENAEEHLRLAVEATEIASWNLNLKTRTIVYSPRMLEIFGHKPTRNLTHSELRNQIHRDDIGLVEKAFEQALKTGSYKYEARVMRPDKKISWIRTQGKVFHDGNNEPEKLIGTLREITEEKQHQQELEESEQKFRLLANSVPQLIWTGDAEGNLNYFNQAVYDYSGLTSEQLSKYGWIDIVHPDDREENIKTWGKAISSGKDFLFEHRFRRFDGEYRWQLSRAIPQRDASGNIQMWVGTSTDIQDMKEMDQQKDYFISLASHELKTPITSIKAYTQILQSKYENSNDSFLIKSLNIVDKQILKLTNLISDLLDLSKIKSGTLTLHKENFNINELIQEVIDEIKHINPDYEIAFVRDEEIALNADRERIGQVLINFLTNAIKYSPASSRIKIESSVDDGNLLVAVEDFGIGINKTDQEKIFERFYRVEGKNEKTFPGFGIGLFIAMEIIHRHNGNIGVKSEPGKGSVFHFLIPLINAN